MDTREFSLKERLSVCASGELLGLFAVERYTEWIERIAVEDNFNSAVAVTAVTGGVNFMANLFINSREQDAYRGVLDEPNSSSGTEGWTNRAAARASEKLGIANTGRFLTWCQGVIASGVGVAAIETVSDGDVNGPRTIMGLLAIVPATYNGRLAASYVNGDKRTQRARLS